MTNSTFNWTYADDGSVNECVYVYVYVCMYVYMYFMFFMFILCLYEGHLESKERFAIKKYLLIIGKKKNVQVLSHTFTYFST